MRVSLDQVVCTAGLSDRHKNWLKKRFSFAEQIDRQQRGFYSSALRCTHHVAEVAELVDALASGASGGNPVEVQVLFSAPFASLWMQMDSLESDLV